MGSEQEVEPSSIPVNTDLRSHPRQLACRLGPPTMEDYQSFPYDLVSHGAAYLQYRLQNNLGCSQLDFEADLDVIWAWIWTWI
ncbi:hypothetical protein M405DRAFT_600698 [Rhizopogon salebrosus TDB-379]|nr:hypothetical protein M405DRAFT_600698 [Rhizopogon salebrosus TDB-379]